MYSTDLNVEPITRTYEINEDGEREYRTRPSRHVQRRQWLPKRYGGRS